MFCLEFAWKYSWSMQAGVCRRGYVLFVQPLQRHTVPGRAVVDGTLDLVACLETGRQRHMKGCTHNWMTRVQGKLENYRW